MPPSAWASLLSTVVEAEFTNLKELTGASDGNLSTHLTKLEAGGLIEIHKTFLGKKPHTSCRITPGGRTALEKHLRALTRLIRQAGTDET